MYISMGKFNIELMRQTRVEVRSKGLVLTRRC